MTPKKDPLSSAPGIILTSALTGALTHHALRRPQKAVRRARWTPIWMLAALGTMRFLHEKAKESKDPQLREAARKGQVEYGKLTAVTLLSTTATAVTAQILVGRRSALSRRRRALVAGLTTTYWALSELSHRSRRERVTVTMPK